MICQRCRCRLFFCFCFRRKSSAWLLIPYLHFAINGTIWMQFEQQWRRTKRINRLQYLRNTSGRLTAAAAAWSSPTFPTLWFYFFNKNELHKSTFIQCTVMFSPFFFLHLPFCHITCEHSKIASDWSILLVIASIGQLTPFTHIRVEFILHAFCFENWKMLEQ